MDAKELKVYSTLLRNWRKGKPSDVFDLMYESSLGYAAVKGVLDILIACGDALSLDIKTYELIGDVEKRAAEIFACGSFVSDRTVRIQLVNVLHRIAELKADDEEYEKVNGEIQKIIAEAERKEAEAFKDAVEEINEKSVESLLSENDFDVFDFEADEDDDRNNGELCEEQARPFYDVIKEDVNEDFDSMMENVFGTVVVCNHCYIGPEHLLLAILCTECTAYDVLAKAGVDGDKYYEKFRAAVPKGETISGFTPRARFLLRRAISIAKDIGGADAKADSKHLLLALLTETRSMAMRILKDTGADIELISDELDKVLKNQED